MFWSNPGLSSVKLTHTKLADFIQTKRKKARVNVFLISGNCIGLIISNLHVLVMLTGKAATSQPWQN